jgi:serine/threonine-protein kinase HipA
MTVPLGDAVVSQLSVWLGPTRVGTLVHLPGEQIVFAFDPAYDANPTRPTLSLGFKTANGRLRAPPPTRVQLPPFFSNLLPEGHLRAYLAARGGIKPVREFFLLALLGADLPGAVELRPEDVGPRSPLIAEDATHAPHALRFSLAGVQLKFSALAEANGGLTIPTSGIGGDWIVKLPSARFASVPEHEHAMLDLAAAVGITVPDHALIPLDQIAGLPADLGPLTGPALAVRRFDRGANSARIHIEDFAQVFGVYPRDKYGRASNENIARVLWAESGLDDTLEFIRRLVFIILTGNADMHLKNWSLRYPDGRTPSLSPAYDLVGTVAFLPDTTLGLSLGGETSMHRITLSSFERFADKVSLPRPAVHDTVLTTIRLFRDAWHSHPAVGTLPAPQRASVDDHLARLPLCHLVEP